MFYKLQNYPENNKVACTFVQILYFWVYFTPPLKLDRIVISSPATAAPCPRAHKSHSSAMTSARPRGPGWHSVFHYILVSLAERHNPTAFLNFLWTSIWFILSRETPCITPQINIFYRERNYNSEQDVMTAFTSSVFFFFSPTDVQMAGFICKRMCRPTANLMYLAMAA